MPINKSRRTFSGFTLASSKRNYPKPIITLKLTSSQARWLQSICHRIKDEFGDHEADEIMHLIHNA